jgi:outer membrane immunogenic protein
MKKLVFAAVAFSLSNVAFSQSAFEGVFGQIGIGYESTKSNISNGNFPSISEDYTISNASNSSGFGGTITVGSYFKVTNTFLLGVGAEYSPLATSNANFTQNLPGVPDVEAMKFKKKNSYNLFLSPAVVLDKDKLAYLKVGYSGMSAQITTSDNEKDNYNFSGYSLGIGYKQIIKGGLYGFAESNYSSYGSKTYVGSTGNVKPNTMNLLVGVGYKF